MSSARRSKYIDPPGLEMSINPSTFPEMSLRGAWTVGVIVHRPRGSHIEPLSPTMACASDSTFAAMFLGAAGIGFVTQDESFFMASDVPAPNPGMTQLNFPAREPATTMWIEDGQSILVPASVPNLRATRRIKPALSRTNIAIMIIVLLRQRWTIAHIASIVHDAAFSHDLDFTATGDAIELAMLDRDERVCAAASTNADIA